jgi:hypothetical protein
MRLGWYFVASSLIACALGAAAACGSSTNGGNGAPDAAVAGPDTGSTRDSSSNTGDDAPGDGASDSSMGGDSSTAGDAPADCMPVLVDPSAIPPFIPPNPPQSACTVAQIQALFQACMTGVPAACTAFYAADAGNAACIACMTSKSTDKSWGPIVNFAGIGMSFPNPSGCMALMDHDGGPGSCAAQFQAYQLCAIDACSTNCPSGATAAGIAAVNQCQSTAATTVCPQYTPPVAQCPACNYPMCFGADYPSDFMSIGAFFCAAAADGGTPVDAGSD